MADKNLILVLDGLVAALEVVGRYNKVLATAREEDREVSDADIDALIVENQEKRAAWDAAIKSG